MSRKDGELARTVEGISGGRFSHCRKTSAPWSQHFRVHLHPSPECSLETNEQGNCFPLPLPVHYLVSNFGTSHEHPLDGTSRSTSITQDIMHNLVGVKFERTEYLTLEFCTKYDGCRAAPAVRLQVDGWSVQHSQGYSTSVNPR